MTTRPRFTFRVSLPVFVLAMFGLLSMIATTSAHAQTFTVLHTFTGGADGSEPFAGVTVGGPGRLYGTASIGGIYRNGVVFELERRASGWVLYPLYEFPSARDGFDPIAPLTIGPNGALYGSTEFGGGGSGDGTVFELQQPATGCEGFICYWSETLLHSFETGQNDGAYPFYTKLIFDQAGNIYGTTEVGGAYDTCPGNQGSYPCGVVFELTSSGGSWTESILHSFDDNGTDGWYPLVGVILDSAGNLYGTTESGGTAGGGTVFELSPSGGGTWTESILYNFGPGYLGGPSNPEELIMDQSGNLYGSTQTGGQHDSGSVFELMPSGGSWTFSTLYNFGNNCFTQSVTMDTAGNFYGNCLLGGAYDEGMVFKLTNSGGSWTLTDLHDFTNGSDGGIPSGGVALDATGNLYGTTQGGGTYGDGVVWEISGLADRH